MAGPDSRIFLLFDNFLQKRRRRNKRKTNISWQRRLHALLNMLQVRRKNFVNAVLTISMLYGCLTFRDVWSWFKPNHSFWDTSSQRWTNRMWTCHLWMKRETFLYLCRELSPTLEKRNTRFREAIPVSKRIAIALWRLATGIDYRSIGQLFGVGRLTCCQITHQVCDALVKVLLKRCIKVVGTDEQIQETKRGFEFMSGLPQCVGAIDGCHIPILAPKEHHSDYFNRKKHHSIILQAVVDHKRRLVIIININSLHSVNMWEYQSVVGPHKKYNFFSGFRMWT